MVKRKKLIIVLVVTLFVFVVLGSTYAYLSWQTADSQKTNVVFTLEQDFWCAADGGGNITQDDVNIAPSSCTNSDHAIKREIKVTPTILRNGLSISMDLWLNVENMGTGFSNSDNFRYVLTTKSDSCIIDIISSGNFKGTSAGDRVLLLDEVTYSNSTLQTYYLYIWLDAAETSPTTMRQSFDLSLGGNCMDESKGEMYYVVYSETDKSLRFYDDSDEIIEGTIYNNLVATKVYTTYQSDAYLYDSVTNNTTSPWNEVKNDVIKIVIEDEIAPKSTANWFAKFIKVSEVDVTKLDTSNVVSMSRMFDSVGFDSSVTSFKITGLDNFDTSKVTDMHLMLQAVGRYANTWDIGDLSEWDTSNVTNMVGLFNSAGYGASTFNNVGDLSGWDVSNVTYMRMMFGDFGKNATSFNIGNIGKWDVSKVTDMHQMFHGTGYKATTFNIGDLTGWDTSKVTDMYQMFYWTGYSANNWSQNLSSWNVNKVTNHTDFNYAVETKVTAPIWVN